MSSFVVGLGSTLGGAIDNGDGEEKDDGGGTIIGQGSDGVERSCVSLFTGSMVNILGELSTPK